MLNKEQIVKLLATNDKAVARALLVVNGNQTANERSAEATINRNGEGFRPCHARMGTSMAQFYEKRGYLTEKQVAYWRKTDKTGAMRIAIYWRQLAEAAELKGKPVVAQQATSTVDIGNALEELMVLNEMLSNAEYELGMVLDSDDSSIIDPLAAQVDGLKVRIATLNAEVKAAQH